MSESPQTNGRRVKQVSARVVQADDLAGSPPPPRPPTIAPTEGLGTSGSAVGDPTFLGSRRRRGRHHRLYRLAQGAIGISLLLTVIAVICGFGDDSVAGQALGASALVLGLTAVVLADRAPLPGRLRGYAIAAAVLAALGIGASILLSGEDDGQQTHSRRHR